MKMSDLLLGRRLASRERGDTKIGWFAAVPAMGLDGLGSASYGPEAALTTLMPLGAAGLVWIGWVIVPMVALLAILYVSYRQTILAYPSNGGAYTVALDNLGRNAALLAAAGLMIDYVLNVAVGISAGVGALTSFLPALHPYTLSLCLAVLVLVGIANLRGTAEAGWLFALPTYVFIATFTGLLAVGVCHVLASGAHSHAVSPPVPIAAATQGVGLWLLLRAFASGCTAMTGVEAVSNGVGAFREPVIANAHRTLTVVCVTLGILMLGITTVARHYRLSAMDQTKPGYESVLSQLASATAGHGAIYYVAMTSVLAVLCLSANTSFVGFPRLCRLVAQDGYLPRAFAVADRRLVFSVGVGFLMVSAGGLLLLFGGIVDRLIPLFAVGAFLTFTISQLGMVAHWRRKSQPEHWRITINAVGAFTTTIALAVIIAAKFLEGAWIVVLAAPAAIIPLIAIRRYYVRLDEELAVGGPFELGENSPPTILVSFERRTRLTDRALRFAMTLSPDVVAVHLLRLTDPEAEENLQALRDQWQAEIAAPLTTAGRVPPRLVLLPAPYREIAGPLLALLEKIDAATPGRSVAILVPEFVLQHWWERLLHGRHATRLRKELILKAGPRSMIITSPWRSNYDSADQDEGRCG